jgi:hypothetical protein
MWITISRNVTQTPSYIGKEPLVEHGQILIYQTTPLQPQQSPIPNPLTMRRRRKPITLLQNFVGNMDWYDSGREKRRKSIDSQVPSPSWVSLNVGSLRAQNLEPESTKTRILSPIRKDMPVSFSAGRRLPGKRGPLIEPVIPISKLMTRTIHSRRTKTDKNNNRDHKIRRIVPKLIVGVLMRIS